MHLQTLLTFILLTTRTIRAHPAFSEFKRSEINTTPTIHQDTRDTPDRIVARDTFLPAGINAPIPLPGITQPPPSPTAPSAAPTTANGPLQLPFPPFPTSTQDPGTTTLAILSGPGVTVVPFTAAASGPEAFSGIATPLGSVAVINPVPDR